MTDLFNNAHTFMGVGSASAEELFGGEEEEVNKIDTQEEGKPDKPRLDRIRR